MSLLAELRRRNVIRMAGLYLVGAWLLVQIAETLLPIFHTPDWVLQALVVLLAIGLLPALVFSWIFELTPVGLKRESEIAPGAAATPQTARRMDRMLLVTVTLALGYLAFDKFVLAPGRDASVPAAATSAVVTDKSIAVLPFADFSAAGDQGWFADGLAEEILNALARTPDLLVSARTSSFRYKGSPLAIPQIAQELGVAHVLEGSVRSTPQRVRVTAQLIRAADGFHLWSQTYDRDVADMMEVQEDLARQIALAMQTRMDPQALAAMAEVGTRSVEAYQAFVRGVATQSSGGVPEFREAYGFFEQARQLDPAFAAAHARAAGFWLIQLQPENRRSGLTEATPAQMRQAFEERIDQAIAKAGNEIDRLNYRAAKALHELHLREGVELLRAYLEQRPGDTAAYENLLRPANQLSERQVAAAALAALWPRAQTDAASAILYASYAHRILDTAKSADQALLLAQRWPDHADVLYQVHRALLWDRRIGEAATVLARWESLVDASEPWRLLPPARQACAEGRRADAEAALAQMPESALSQRWHVLMLLGRIAEADVLVQSLESAGYTSAPASFLIYPQFDPAPFPSLRQLLEREQSQRPPPKPEPYACAPVPREEVRR